MKIVFKERDEVIRWLAVPEWNKSAEGRMEKLFPINLEERKKSVKYAGFILTQLNLAQYIKTDRISLPTEIWQQFLEPFIDFYSIYKELMEGSIEFPNRILCIYELNFPEKPFQIQNLFRPIDQWIEMHDKMIKKLFIDKTNWLEYESKMDNQEWRKCVVKVNSQKTEDKIKRFNEFARAFEELFMSTQLAGQCRISAKKVTIRVLEEQWIKHYQPIELFYKTLSVIQDRLPFVAGKRVFIKECLNQVQIPESLLQNSDARNLLEEI